MICQGNLLEKKVATISLFCTIFGGNSSGNENRICIFLQVENVLLLVILWELKVELNC